MATPRSTKCNNMEDIHMPTEKDLVYIKWEMEKALREVGVSSTEMNMALQHNTTQHNKQYTYQ
eukprot:11224018-Ditylum_brightwellii.AAC.2